MIHDEEFDLTWADPPPTWIENVGPLLEFWGNPIFQRRYVLWQMQPTMGIRSAFIVGFGLSLVLNLLFRFLAEDDEYLELGFLTTIVLPGLIVFAVTGIRLFLTSLVGTPLELRLELYSGALGAILSTPLNDARIYYAECISGLLRGLGAMEEVLSMLAGLIVPFIAVMFPELWAYAEAMGIELFWWVVLCLMAIVIIIQLNVLITFAAGLYSMLVPVVATVPATLVHILVFAGATVWIELWCLEKLMGFNFMLNVDLLAIFLLLGVMLIVTIALFTVLTANFGVKVFAKSRRPGYYEPDGLNAAGFLKHDSGTSVIRFGDSV